MGFDKLEVVRKLLAKADRAATPQEAASYTGKALWMCARHGIDAALVAAADPGRDELGAQRVEVHEPYSAGKARLLAWTAIALRCRAVLHQARGGRVDAVTVYGFAADRERVELLYSSLLLQVSTQLTAQRPPRSGESLAAYRRSWLHGFAVRVHRRLVEAERAAAEAGPTPTAGDSHPRAELSVVLADRAEQVRRGFAATFPELDRARGRSLSGSGFGAGAAAGDRADLGDGRLGARPLRPVGR